MLKLSDHPHRRYNPLIDEWILVSPQRTKRPWQGKVEKIAEPASLQYDPQCYLCPGNVRAGSARNEKYTSTFVFDNDFSALLQDIPDIKSNQEHLIVAEAERGICRVVCFSPRHDLTLPTMDQSQIRKVVRVWIEQYRHLGRLPWIKHVQIFENRGVMMGASNPHPHCQIWANATLPNQPKREQEMQTAYRAQHHSCLLCDYLQLEIEKAERIICENQNFVVVVPFWATWPFETLLLSKRHLGNLVDLREGEQDSLADIIQRLTIRYDNLFQISFPYSMGFHQSPNDDQIHPEWHFHGHYYPPLLRSATVPKFMVGYEMLASPQRDITPEMAAHRLREMSEVHYLIGGGR